MKNSRENIIVAINHLYKNAEKRSEQASMWKLKDLVILNYGKMIAFETVKAMLESEKEYNEIFERAKREEE